MRAPCDHVAHSVIAQHRRDVVTTPHRSPAHSATITCATDRSQTKWDAASPHFAGGATRHKHRPRHPLPTPTSRTDNKGDCIDDGTSLSLSRRNAHRNPQPRAVHHDSLISRESRQ